MNKFYQNLEEIKQGEKAVVELLKKKGHNAALNPARNYEAKSWGDIIVDGEFLEVKTDWASLYTGRICVERATLDHTRARLFVYILPTAYILWTKGLRNLCLGDIGTFGGDQQHKIHLFPKDQFMLNAKQL